jgi:5-methylcytosine-specific restriction endonuclease McrA
VSDAPLPAPNLVENRPGVKPLAPQRFAVQFTMSQSARDKLQYAQELLGHPVASGNIAEIFERALDALIPELEKQKFAATRQPRRSARSSEDPRHIPAHVRRAVWERDGGQCTFVSESGRRCQERKGLQFDHVLEVARGGEANVSDIRLRCWAHNQFEAERTFGAAFMRHKRIAAAEERAATKGRTAAALARATAATPACSSRPSPRPRSAPAAP